MLSSAFFLLLPYRCSAGLLSLVWTELIRLFAVFVPMTMTECLYLGSMGVAKSLAWTIACVQTRHHRQPCGETTRITANLHAAAKNEKFQDLVISSSFIKLFSYRMVAVKVTT